MPEPAESVRDRLDVVLAVAAGGGIGAAGRYGLSHAVPAGAGRFPWGTFIINTAGSLVLGLLLVVLSNRFPQHRYARPLLGTGVIGAFTTFSTYAVETDSLARAGDWAVAAGYVGASLATGLLAVRLGMALARLVPPRKARVP